MDEEKKVRLYGVETPYRDVGVKVVAFLVVEKPKSYQVVERNNSAAHWRHTINKSEMGHEFFLSPEEALRHYIGVREGLIASCTKTIEASSALAASAKEALAALIPPDEGNG